MLRFLSFVMLCVLGFSCAWAAPLVLYVGQGGHDTNPGTAALPFATPERARQAIRTLKQQGELPRGGVEVRIKSGVYARTESFTLTAEDAGTLASPIVYTAAPHARVRVSGGKRLPSAACTLVNASSPVWHRLDPSAQGKVVQVDLRAQGISDFGALQPRGYGGSTGPSALELFINGQRMTLSRWPDVDAHGPPPSTPRDDAITIYGSVTPDISGHYTKCGVSDGVHAYQRQGLVSGKQYYLYRYRTTNKDNPFFAWFLTTNKSGYPSSENPFWYHYACPDFSTMQPAQGATGNVMMNAPDAPEQGFVKVAAALSDSQFTYAGDRPSRWAEARDIWFYGYWKYAWVDVHMNATRIDPATKTITLALPPSFGIAAGQPYYAENLLEEITTPGEWYLDRTTGILYFWPPAPLKRCDIVVSLLPKPLIALQDTAYITIRGLTLEAGRADLCIISGGMHNCLDHCLLRNGGTNGATITGVDNGLSYCEVTGVGDTGVDLSGGDRPTLAKAGNYVRDCHIHHYARTDGSYRPAVCLHGVGQIVAHNLIHDAPHNAILFSGNEHLIEYNDIHDVCQRSSDAGAIYTGQDWGLRGNVIRYNFLHDISSPFFLSIDEGNVTGVYLDDGGSGIRVFGNIFYRIAGHALELGGGRDNRVENNIIVRCGDALSADHRVMTWLSPGALGKSWNYLAALEKEGIHYQQAPWATAYPELARIPNDPTAMTGAGAHWLAPEGCIFSRNIGYANTQWISEDKSANLGTLCYYAEVKDNLADVDPRFVNEAKLNFTLRADSPALALPGFQPIPFKKIGIEPER
jgi:hypothetical protein